MMWVIKGPILVLTLCVWALVGLIFWIPLLARVTAFFSVGILRAALGHRDAFVYGRQLESAIAFYPDGFRRTVEALAGRAGNDGNDGDEWEPEPQLPLGRFLGEALWTAVFWVGALAILAALGRDEWLPWQARNLAPYLWGELGRLRASW